MNITSSHSVSFKGLLTKDFRPGTPESQREKPLHTGIELDEKIVSTIASDVFGNHYELIKQPGVKDSLSNEFHFKITSKPEYDIKSHGDELTVTITKDNGLVQEWSKIGKSIFEKKNHSLIFLPTYLTEKINIMLQHIKSNFFNAERKKTSDEEKAAESFFKD